MHIELIASCALLILSLFWQGSSSPNGPKAASTAQQSAQSFGDSLRRTVGFLQVDYSDGLRHKSIRGTCFFVFYPDERLGPDKGFLYLVTNRHMAVPGVEVNEHFPVDHVFVILNSKPTSENGSSGVSGVALGSAPAWIFPEDGSVDLAILPFAPSWEKFDYLTIPLAVIATQDVVKQRSLAPGDTVTFAGFFYQWPGDKKIQPIVRQGVLAMMPDEKIGTTLNQQPGNLYLADVHAFHGNSGSPIFVNSGGVRGNSLSGNLYYLLGVISGYYPEGESFSVPAAHVLSGEVRDNSGIATVVPAYQLISLLDSPPAKRLRDAAVRPSH